MQLKDYRTQRGLTLADMAELMGFVDRKSGKPHATTVFRHETGKQTPDFDTIEKYRKATGGEVTVTDWQALRASVKKAKAAA